MIKPPCYDTVNKRDCEKRCAGCASTCPEWADYVKERDTEYKQRELGVGYETNGKRRAIRKYISEQRHRRSWSLYKEHGE